MSYSEDLKIFRAAHTYKASIVEGSTFHYVLSGKKDGKTLVLLNGGMNTMEMWMGYVDALCRLTIGRRQISVFVRFQGCCN